MIVMSTEEYRKIRIETILSEKEVKAITADLKRVENTYVQVKQSSKSEGVHTEFYFAPFLQTFILIIGLAANLLQIADILHKHLGKLIEKGRSVNFRFDGKEISIKGNWEKQEIEAILNGFSEILEQEEKIKEIEIIAKEKRIKLQKELDEINETLPTYEDLVRIGEKEKERRPSWKNKYNGYFKRLQELRTRKAILEELLGN